MFTVYVIYNRKHRKIYIGQTGDIQKRLHQHNDCTDLTHTFTKKFDGEWILIYSEKYPVHTDALKREKQLKSYRGRQYLKQYIPL